jgi:hypothetical protein
MNDDSRDRHMGGNGGNGDYDDNSYARYKN